MPEARRLRRTHRPLQAALCQKGRREGGEVNSVILSAAKEPSANATDASASARLSMTMKRTWLGAAKLVVNSLNAVTNGLTTSDATTADRNIDMLIGGQAIIEGVMMRSLTGYSIAVRKPDGGISIKKDHLASIAKKYPFLKFPVLRGSVALIQSLILGFQALNYSASVASEGEEGEEMSNWAIAGILALNIVLGIGIFILAPLGLTNLIR